MKELIALVSILGFFEVKGMLKKKQKKEIAVFVCLALITLAFGYFYFSDPYRSSFSNIILNLLGIKH